MATASRPSPETAALVVGAGSGERFGQAKAFYVWRGEPLICWAARPLARSAAVDRLVLVVRAEDRAQAADVLDRLGKPGTVVAGGATRSASVRAGLAVLPPEVSRVVVHDAARPRLSDALVERLLSARGDCIVPFLPLHDALHRIAGPRQEVVAREGVRRVQTPQVFSRALLARAHRSGGEAADDGGLVLSLGEPITYVPGEEANVKVTTPADLTWLSALERTVRVGQGFDVHRLGPGRRFVLCGVEIPSEVGPVGHSDADAGCHALMDAILGAAALPDIGHLFPPGDARFKDADSLQLLREVMGRIQAAGFALRHADVTVVLEAPRIAPWREEMRRRLAAALGVETSSVSVKATTAEGLGPLGLGEGIAAMAVATLEG